MAVMALCILCGCVIQREHRGRELLDRVSELTEAGDLDQALVTAEQGVEVAPNSHYSWWALGAVRIERGEYAAAEDALRKAIGLEPGEMGVHLAFGMALRMQGKPDEAITEFRKVIKAGHRMLEAREELAAALVQAHRWDEAVTQSRRVLEAKPSSADARLALGSALTGRGDTDEAIDEFHQALRLEPDYAEVHAALADALRRRGKLDEAAESARRAIQLDHLSEPYLTLGLVLLERGQYEQAIEQFQKAQDANSENPAVHGAIAEAFLALGEWEEAIVEYRRAAELAPGDPEIAEAFADTLRRANRLSQAAAQYRRLLEIDADNTKAAATLAQMLVQMGEADDAVRLLQELEKAAPSHWAPWLSAALSRALIFRGDVAAARQRLRQASTAEGSSQASLTRSHCWVYLGHWRTAVEEAAYAESALKGDAKPVLSKAMALALSGRAEDAEDAARKARSLMNAPSELAAATLAYVLAAQDKDDEARAELKEAGEALAWEHVGIEALYLAGLAYRQLGETQEATALFQRAVDRWPKHPWSVNMREMLQGGDGG